MTQQTVQATRVQASRGAGVALVASGITFFATEFIAAAAWTDPPYSYTYHFISDLGVHGPSVAFDQYMYSPLAWVMNTGFILFGLIALTGIALLSGLRGRKRTIALAAVMAIGTTLVGCFPGSAEAVENGTAAFHGLGAFAAFICGNALIIRLGRQRRSLGIPEAIGRPLVPLGVFGLISMVGYMVLLGMEAPNLVGLVERGAVYPVLIGLICVGTGQLRS